MKVVELRNKADLLPLRERWNALLRDSGSNTIFLTWEWITAWWSAYGTSGELRILAAFDDANVLRGLAPLRSKTMRKYGQSVNTLSFTGDGSNDSDYLDFIIASGYEKAVMEAFHIHYARELEHGTILLLNEVPATSPNLSHLKEWAEPQRFVWTQTDVACGTVHLPENWDAYLALLKPRFRTKVRSVLRNLESRPEVRFGFCDDAGQIEHLLSNLFDLHTRRWNQDGKPGVFGWQQKRDFYFGLSPMLLERGWLRFSWLEWNEKVLACQYGFAYGGTYFHLQEGYEPASEHWNAGMGLRAWTIREFLGEGLREYDFLGGIGRHKLDWGAVAKHSKQIQLARATYKNQVYCHGPEWEVRARESVRALVPEKLLAARQARLEQQHQPSANAPEGSGTEKSWIRNAAAHCYLSLGMPRLLRSFRDRYRVSMSPKFSCRRRLEAAGRILYYHRVNDDGDPFFPATSTRLFEQEMQYLARHYKVVSLSSLLDRLGEESPENVVAITFDDGYRDNYDNAFPILQRYGLPATIFLTTGSIDSREPIWFERLAQAAKTTTREYLDLEIDVPRRFWLRTQAERVESNNAIFALLRGLPNADRQVFLEGILERLGATSEERHGKMLTWDQIRAMKAHAIDFGGHTVTHPFLSKLPQEQVKWEVLECKRRIEAELQLPVEHFAYPNGREEDFGMWNKEIIREAGYRAAVTTIWGVNYRSTDRMELRRGQPWEENPALFAYKLDWYQLVNE